MERSFGTSSIGLADRDSMQKVDERTIYHWASITKTLTAVAIMQLRDRGKLTLDDKVTTWVPELRQVHDPYGSMDDITIRMLLAHTSGFQNPTWPYGSGAAWQPFEPTRWEQLVAMMPYQELAVRPGLEVRLQQSRRSSTSRASSRRSPAIPTSPTSRRTSGPRSA